ncbi:hypothetical protein AD951_12630 [Acetobacter malorum]|uniref:Uncharacterized protein n=1 Tax=Acetobacter malorum TaxID=178901 RepID=A0A149UJK6_9PROT|nr:hypothetical protein AD951_12630 [Acetobacter malorum]
MFGTGAFYGWGERASTRGWERVPHAAQRRPSPLLYADCRNGCHWSGDPLAGPAGAAGEPETYKLFHAGDACVLLRSFMVLLAAGADAGVR